MSLRGLKYAPATRRSAELICSKGRSAHPLTGPFSTPFVRFVKLH